MKSRMVIAALATLVCLQAVALAWLLRPRPAPVAVAPSTMEAPRPASASGGRTGSNTVVMPASLPAPAAARVDWRQVESGDYKQYIANLRSIGCPEETIRDIIIADVNKLFEPRLAALRAKVPKFEFWRTGMDELRGLDSATVEARQKLNGEKRALLRELLGVEPPDDTAGMLATGFGLVDLESQLQQMMAFLPADKRRAAGEIEARYGAKTVELIKDTGGVFDEDQNKLMTALQRAKEAELARLLDSKEFEQYQLHMSDMAQTMRFELDGFEPSEQEFRDIFAMRKAYENATVDLHPDSDAPEAAAKRKERAEAEAKLDEELKARLGGARFAEYERVQDYDYKSLASLGKKYDLPKESVVKVYDMKQAAQEQAGRLRKDKALPKEQRDAALRAIRAETESAVRGALGDKAFDSYQKRSGNWIRSIAPDPKPKQ